MVLNIHISSFRLCLWKRITWCFFVVEGNQAWPSWWLLRYSSSMPLERHFPCWHLFMGLLTPSGDSCTLRTTTTSTDWTNRHRGRSPPGPRCKEHLWLETLADEELCDVGSLLHFKETWTVHIFLPRGCFVCFFVYCKKKMLCSYFSEQLQSCNRCSSTTEQFALKLECFCSCFWNKIIFLIV